MDARTSSEDEVESESSLEAVAAVSSDSSLLISIIVLSEGFSRGSSPLLARFHCRICVRVPAPLARVSAPLARISISLALAATSLCTLSSLSRASASLACAVNSLSYTLESMAFCTI